jgi:hypothetical protein
MKKHSIVDYIISDLDNDLNQIFDCDQKIKSLLSELRAINVEVEMLRHLVQAHNPHSEVSHGR